MKSEARIQAECNIWFHNKYPALRGCLCCNLGNSANKITGARNKAMGVQSGRSDMAFYYSGKAYMIEFKLLGERQSLAQINWENLMQNHHFSYFLITSLEEFQNLIWNIIK